MARLPHIFGGGGEAREPGLRALAASAMRIDMTERQEARSIRKLHQGWQTQAWEFRDTIGEFRYATNFLANCSARMRLFAGGYLDDGQTDTPVPLDQLRGIPPGVVEACAQAMDDLGNGRVAVSGLMHQLSSNWTVAGEAWLLGREDLGTLKNTWSIRSVDEILITDTEWRLREAPMDVASDGWTTLDPDTTVLARMWNAHPRFAMWADSPSRAILDDMESLAILRRDIRATGRSRLAGSGFLKVPDEVSIKSGTNDNLDPQSDSFLDELTEAMMAPIADEGVASSVVPILIRGPALALQQFDHLDWTRSFDALSSSTRAELVGIIATGLDLPKEIITGVADLNHWSAWQVDDNTFRHHIEPHVIQICDAMTSAYFRPFLLQAGVPQAWVDRLVLWYDPIELVTHPDQTTDAFQLHDRKAISNKALRNIAGFSEADAPSVDEQMERLIENMRTWPPNVVMEIIHQLNPGWVIPPITVAGTVPGVSIKGVDVGQQPVAPGAEAAPAGVSAPPGPPPAAGGPAPVPAPPAPGLTASSTPAAARLSRRLVSIDQDLRVRVQAAANAAMLRQLERAGARLRAKVTSNETMKVKIDQRPNERAAAILGPDAVTAAGLSVDELMGTEWSSLQAQFLEWTRQAQDASLAAACKIAGIDPSDPAVTRAEAAFAESRANGWQVLSRALTSLGHHLLYNPDPNTPAGAWGDRNPDRLVPNGLVRASLAVAGGAPANSVSVENTVALAAGDSSASIVMGDATTATTGQIGTGSVISDFLHAADVNNEGYVWVHGPALNAFEPHENLDGVVFATFTDQVLANNGSWPAGEFFTPGDHLGCTCDFQPLWSPSS